MKRLGMLLVLVVFCFALPAKVDYIDGESSHKPSPPTSHDRVVISAIGDIRAIMGPQGKSIAVSANGDAIAVIYGDPTPDPDNYMEIKIGYSLDDGATWDTYGPFSSELRRIYPGVAGSSSFDTDPGQLFFSWQESPSGYETGDMKVMIEEGTPSASSPSTPLSLPRGPDIYPWITSIAVNPEDPAHIVASAWSYLNNGNNWCYAWVSEDGGYTWSDTIPMLYLDAAGSNGHLCFGTGDYIAYTYQDNYDWHGTPLDAYPYYVESTDGGYTWSAETPLPEVPLLEPVNSQFWWHELDGMVINGELWFIHNDINQVFADSADMWIFHGTGGPGAWTWDIIQVGDYYMDVVIADTNFGFAPSQYTSMSYDPVSGMILAGFKANYFKGYPAASPTEIWHDGAHVGGIYSFDNGATWEVTAPLSDANTGEIIWGDWSATETAHMLVNEGGGNIYAHTVWGRDPGLELYYERGAVRRFTGIQETGDNIVTFDFEAQPTITSDNCHVAFSMARPGAVTLNLYDTAGRLVTQVFDGRLEKGNHQFDVRTSQLSNGAYFVVLDAESGTTARKIIKY